MITSLAQLETLWGFVKDCDGNIEVSGSVLEVTCSKENLERFQELINKGGISVKTSNARRVDIQFDTNTIEVFKSEEEFLDRFDLTPNILENKYGFIFDFRGSYLAYDRETKKCYSEESNVYEHFVNHIVQYREILKIFLTAENSIIKINHPTAAGNEMIVVVDGETKMLTNISYKRIDKEAYSYPYTEYPIETFKTKIKLDIWLTCFKSEVCKFIDGQSEVNKTFSRLYLDFDYIFNLAERNYQLYLSKFSFDKIRKQFKTEKNRYFEGLNEAQSKIAAQVIAIPLTIGAAVLSANVFQNVKVPAGLISIAIATYSAFVIWVILMHLHDVRKIGRDLKDEEREIKNHYSGLFAEFKDEFSFLKRKRRLTRVLGWATILYLGILISLLLYFKDLSLVYYVLFI